MRKCLTSERLLRDLERKTFWEIKGAVLLIRNKRLMNADNGKEVNTKGSSLN